VIRGGILLGLHVLFDGNFSAMGKAASQLCAKKLNFFHAKQYEEEFRGMNDNGRAITGRGLSPR